MLGRLEAAAPQEQAADSGESPPRRCSGGAGMGVFGRGASVGVWEGGGEAHLGNAGRRRPFRGELELAGGYGEGGQGMEGDSRDSAWGSDL